jgi:hypothetical protein
MGIMNRVWKFVVWSLSLLTAFSFISNVEQRKAAQAFDAASPTQVPAGANGGGRGGTGQGGRGAGPVMKPSALRAVPAETTAARMKDPNWKAPRTAWGHPDLEGTWTSDDMRGIPTSRPPQQADRESLTPEEFARRAGGDEASRDRAVNQETFLRNEFGVRTFGYTSFIVEPPTHTDKMRLTEWFTRIDPQMIDYRFRVEDPDTFTAPFTMRMTITEQPGYQLYEYSCHEGNTAVGQALSGERAYEKQVAEAKAKGLPVPPTTTGMEVYSGAR